MAFVSLCTEDYFCPKIVESEEILIFNNRHSDYGCSIAISPSSTV